MLASPLQLIFSQLGVGWRACHGLGLIQLAREQLYKYQVTIAYRAVASPNMRGNTRATILDSPSINLLRVNCSHTITLLIEWIQHEIWVMKLHSSSHSLKISSSSSVVRTYLTSESNTALHQHERMMSAVLLYNLFGHRVLFWTCQYNGFVLRS